MNYAYTIPSSIRKTAALLAIITLAATSMPLVAYAAAIFGPTSATLNQATTEYASGAINASGHQNLVLSFSYDAESLDSGDSFVYGWRQVGGSNNDFTPVTGANEVGTTTPSDEIGSVSVPLPAGAQISDLEVYITVTVDSGSDEVQLTNITVTGDPVTTTGTLTAEEFVAVDAATYKGISVGFKTEGFGTVTAVTVTMERADGSTVTKTANSGVISIINQDTSGGDKLTAPFVIEEGSFTEAGDVTYWNPAPATWTLATRPVKVTITVTDENGSVSVVNSTFNDGAPSWPTYESLVPKSQNLTTEVVTSTDLKGFVIEATGGGDTQFVFNASAPLGDGNVKFTSDSQNSARAGVGKAVNVQFADLAGLAYETRQNAANVSAGNATYRLRFDADGDLNTTNDIATLIYEPYWQNNESPDAAPVVPGVWQEWDVENGIFWASVPAGSATFFASNGVTNGAGGPPFFTLDEISAFYPNAVVTWFGVGIGSYNPLYDIDVDGVVFGTEDSTTITKTIYDFEPLPKDTETIVVTGNTASGENQPGWLFNRDTSTATPFEFNEDEASIGDGALYVLPIGSSTPADKFIAEYFALAEMGDVDSFSYDFNIGQNATTSDADQFYLNVYANFATSSPTKFYDCRYNVVPTTGVVGGWTTVTFDPSQTYPVTTRTGAEASPETCPGSPAAMGADAVIRAFAINVGDTNADDAGVDGYIDNVVFETDTKVTTFDFEMESTDDDDDDDDDRGSSASGGRAGGTSGPTPQVLGASTDQEEMLALLNAIEARLYELLAERNAATPTWTPTVSGASTSTGGPATGSDDEEVVEEDEEDSTSTPVTIPDDEEDEDEAEDGETEVPWAWIAWGLVALWLLASGAAYWHLRQNPGSTYMRIVQGVFGVIGLGLLISFFLFGLAGVLFWPSLILAVGAITAYFWTLE